MTFYTYAIAHRQLSVGWFFQYRQELDPRGLSIYLPKLLTMYLSQWKSLKDDGVECGTYGIVVRHSGCFL